MQNHLLLYYESKGWDSLAQVKMKKLESSSNNLGKEKL